MIAFWINPGRLTITVKGKRRSSPGTTFHYILDQNAGVVIEIQKKRSGRVKGKRCVAVTKRNRKARPCPRWTTVRVRAVKHAHAGKNTFKWLGIVNGNKLLTAGAYRVYIAAENPAGWSAVHHRPLTAVRKLVKTHKRVGPARRLRTARPGNHLRYCRGQVRVLIDTTYARRAPFSGTGIYIQKLCEQLSCCDRIELREAVNRGRRPPAGGGLGSARNLLVDLWWAAVELPRLARRARADVIHHPLPAISPMAWAAQVVTVADLAFERLPDHFDRGFRTYAHVTHRAAARAAAAVVCVSETTAADARSVWGVARDRIVVAPHGPGQDVAGAERERAHLLYVGDGEPRKNLPALLEAYRLYRASVPDPLPLLLAGSATASGAGVTVVTGPRPSGWRSCIAARWRCCTRACMRVSDSPRLRR